MIWTLKNLIEHSTNNLKNFNNEWVPARPKVAPFLWRIRAAVAVLRGKADAVIWPASQ